jgi:hypothetical protein
MIDNRAFDRSIPLVEYRPRVLEHPPLGTATGFAIGRARPARRPVDRSRSRQAAGRQSRGRRRAAQPAFEGKLAD